MPQYEFKVVKCRVCDQTFYTSWLGTYGWQVQNIQEFVDQVVNQSMGFSSSMGSGSMFGDAYFHPYSNSAHLSGYQTNHNWGSQINTSVTNVKTKLSITFFRDVAMPNRGELMAFENRWWAASDQFMKKLLSVPNAKGQKQWPEFKAMEAIDQEARAFIREHSSRPAIETPKSTEPKPKQVENKPLQLPDTPASATLKRIEVTHNVIHSGQPGIQIKLAFTLQHRKGLPCGILAYFCDENRIGLKDINHKFSTSDGHVSLGSSFTAEFDDVLVNDYLLFMPYAELDQPDGERLLTFNVQIYDDSGETFIAKSEFFGFRFSKNGSAMHGEPIGESSQLTPKITPVAARQAAKSQRPVTVKKSPPAVTPVPKNKKERERAFIKASGWTEVTEDRQLYMDGVFLVIDRSHAEALEKFRGAIQINPKEAGYWSMAATALFNQLKFDESYALLEEGLKELPNNVVLLGSLGTSYVSRSEFRKGEEIAGRLEKIDGKDAAYKAALIRAFSAELQKDYPKAIRLYDQADACLGDNNPEKGYFQQRCREAMKKK